VHNEVEEMGQHQVNRSLLSISHRITSLVRWMFLGRCPIDHNTELNETVE
jgi:hypothetical protein